MSHSYVAFEFFQIFSVKNFIDQSHTFMNLNIFLRTIGIRNGDAAAFLSPVLQGKQPVVHRGGHIASIQVIHTHDTAFFV